MVAGPVEVDSQDVSVVSAEVVLNSDETLDLVVRFLDSVEVGLDKVDTPLGIALQLRTPPNGAFGLTLPDVFVAALLNVLSERRP